MEPKLGALLLIFSVAIHVSHGDSQNKIGQDHETSKENADLKQIAQQIPFNLDALAAFKNQLINGSLSGEEILKIASLMKSEERGRLLGLLPTDDVVNLLQTFSHDQLDSLLTSLPTECVKNISQKILLLSRYSSLLSNFLNVLPDKALLEFLSDLTPEMLAKVAKLVTVDQLERIVGSLLSPDTSGVPEELLEPVHGTGKIKRSVQNSVNMDGTSRSRVARQTFNRDSLLVSMGPTMIANVANEHMAAYLQKFTGHEIVVVAKVLNDTERMRVLMSLTGEEILNLTQRMTPEERGELLLLLPGDGIVSLTEKMTQEQLETLMRSLLAESIVEMTQNLTAEQNFIVISKLSPTGVLDLMAMMNTEQNLEVLGNLPLNGVLKLITSFSQDEMARLMTITANYTLHDLFALLSSYPKSEVKQAMSFLIGKVVSGIPKILSKGFDKLKNASALSNTNVPQCLEDLETFIFSLKEEWAQNMFDAYGKPARGLLKGNTRLHGNFDQCVEINQYINDTANQRYIKGSYCGAEIVMPPGVLPPTPGKGILPDVQVFVYACLPSSCLDYELTNIVKSASLPLNITIPGVSCQKDENFADDAGAIVAICIFSVLGALIILGTIIDLKHRHQKQHTEESEVAYNAYDEAESHFNKGFSSEPDKTAEVHSNGDVKVDRRVSNPTSRIEQMKEIDDRETSEEPLPLRMLEAFSLLRNTQEIFDVDDTAGFISCLHGIRVLSILWVIVGHTFFFMALFFENPLTAAENLETIMGEPIINSTLASDTFLVVSGCLASFWLLRFIEQEGHIRLKTMVKYYIHRAVRLDPAYGIAIMIFTCILPYASDGPEWTAQSHAYFQPCKSYWWTNLLYINNFYKSYKDQCAPWTWYLSVDMQLYWIAPILILPLAIGYRIISGFLIFGLVIMQAVLTIYFEEDVNGDYLRNSEEYIWQIFQKPYCRVAPYVLGIGLGYILKEVGGRFRLSPGAKTIGWLLAIGASLTCTFVKYDENRFMLETPFYWSHTARAVHEALFRPFFSLAVCWIIFACATGNGGLINSILSWRSFRPLSRLTYCIFLLHPAIIQADQWHSRVPVYFTVSYVLQRAAGYFLISVIFAYLLSVIVEAPITALERTLFKRRNLPVKATL